MPVMRALSCLAVLAAMVALTRDGAADPAPEKLECARSFEQAQRLRQAHQLRAAKGELLVCVEKCSPGLRKECLSWLGDVEAALPSLVITARAADGTLLTSVRVLIDGVEVTGGLMQPLALDPGDHDLVLDAPGLARLEQRVTVREGERERKMDITLVAPAPSPKPSPPTSAPPPTLAASAAQGGDHEGGPRPVPPLVYATLGLGLVAMAVGGYFQISGMSQQSSLGDCKPDCREGQIDSARTALWAGNVSLLIAAASLATATVLYLSRPTQAPRIAGLAMDSGGVGIRF